MFTRLSLALVGVAALALPASTVADTNVGYAGSDSPEATTCDAGQACTYFSDGGSEWTIPADGQIDGFTVTHTAAGGSQQVRLLLLSHADGSDSWAVDAATGLGPLSSDAGADSFTLSPALPAQQGESLAVTVVPDAQDYADGVIVSTPGSGGSSQGCELQDPATGTAFSNSSCSIIPTDDASLALSVHLITTGTTTTTGGPTTTTPGGSTTTTPGGTTTTPTGTTTTSGTGGDGGTIDPYQAQQIAEYKAAQIKFYKATLIKPLPPAPPIRKLPALGWGFTGAASCSALCVLDGTILAENIGLWNTDGLVFFAGDARAAHHARAAAVNTFTKIGGVRLVGRGRLRPKLSISPRYRSRLLHASRGVRLVIVERVTDRKYGFRKTRQQVYVLHQ